MGGCTNCAGKSGCDTHKRGMLQTVGEWMDALYPSKVWGEMDDAFALEDQRDESDLYALAQELAGELRGAAFVRQGEEGDVCDYIYILCQGREPCALQVKYVGLPFPAEWEEGDVLQEFYLRIAISAVAPLAVVQQVQVKLFQEEGTWMLSEELSAGVYDAPLLKRFQRLVAILPSYGLTHVDMGEISAPPEGFNDDAYQSMFARPAHQVNYLFFRSPSTTCAMGPLHWTQPTF